jgi:endonuclease/exonuclease/phosphatase family metal-dependent hydrolase
MQPPLRVLTLNCWNVSEPLEARMRLMRAGIEALDPDVVGLQEIVVRRDGFDQGARLLDGLGYQTAFGAAFRWDEAGRTTPADGDGDAFGNVIASRWTIRESQVLALPGAESGESSRSSPPTSTGSSNTGTSASGRRSRSPSSPTTGPAPASCRASWSAT